MSNPTQPIMAKTCNSIIQTILLIIIILYTILCKVISFENYICTHCELFNHRVQHPYCGLFGHTIQQNVPFWFSQAVLACKCFSLQCLLFDTQYTPCKWVFLTLIGAFASTTSIIFCFTILKNYFINYTILFYNTTNIPTFIFLFYLLK